MIRKLYQSPFGELLEAAFFRNESTGGFNDFCVRLTVDFVITNGTSELNRTSGFLGFEPGVNIDGYIGLGQVLSMQATACH